MLFILMVLIIKDLFALDIIIPDVPVPVGCYPPPYNGYVYHYFDVVEITGLETGEYYYITRWDNMLDNTPPLSYIELLYSIGETFIDRDDFVYVDPGGSEGPKYKYTGSSSTAYFDYNFEIPNEGLIVGDYTTRPGIRIRKASVGTTAVIKHSTITIVDPSSISGGSLTCTSSASFTLNDQPFDSTVSWVIKQNGNTRASGTGTTASASNFTNGDADVDFTISFGCGLNSIIKHKDFWVGKPIPSILGPVEIECDFPEWYFIDSRSISWGDFQWSTDSNMDILGTTTGHKAQAEGLEEGYGQIFCEVTNTCGSTENRLVVWIDCFSFFMAPNPSNDIVNITIDESKIDLNSVGEYEIRIYNNQNVLIYQNKTENTSTNINTGSFKSGIYTVRLLYNKKEYARQLVVNH